MKHPLMQGQKWHWYFVLMVAISALSTTGTAQQIITKPQKGTSLALCLPPAQPRVLILTDISSLTAGVREPDDGQSLIRLLLYANDLDIEGIIASSNMGHGQTVRPELIRQAIAAYAKVRPNLLLHDKDYPVAENLLEGVKAGQPVAGPKTPVEDSIGEGKDTEASEWIIKRVDRSDMRPLWVLVWGGTADLAQALWKVRQTRSPEETQKFLEKLRVHAIGDQDSTGPWIRAQFPNLFYILRQFGYRGMYRGGDMSLVSSQWVETHIRNGHGALGALYPNYNGGDIWSNRLGPVRGIKEGDTPSFLGLISNGLNNPSSVTMGGWGGHVTRMGDSNNQFTDVPDEDAPKSDPDPRMSAVYRWRPAFQADFQARLDWCVKPYAAANHPPVPVVLTSGSGITSSGEAVTLDARSSSDPDGNRLICQWTVMPGEGTYRGSVKLSGENTPLLRFTAPPVTRSETLHILLTLRDDGEPSLTSYARVIIRLQP